MLSPLRTVPSLRPRVWGGTRLTPPGSTPIGESWLVGPESTIVGSTDDGLTLAHLADRHREALVGRDAPDAGRFPLLVKLLDPAEWLSVQVHPDDEQAIRLEGPGSVGKAEGWYAIEAAPEAAILLGARSDASPAELLAGLEAGRVAHLLEQRAVRAGDAWLVPAGTLHAVGPGALIYELQQASDITYRCDDWGRPATAGRALHTRQSIDVARLEAWPGQVATSEGPEERGLLFSCDKFVLERLRTPAGTALACDTDGSSVHVLTAVREGALVEGSGWTERLARFESLVVPAATGAYRVSVAPDGGTEDVAAPDQRSARAAGSGLVLLARLPGATETTGGAR